MGFLAEGFCETGGSNIPDPRNLLPESRFHW
jgi:hypothetical protein